MSSIKIKHILLIFSILFFVVEVDAQEYEASMSNEGIMIYTSIVTDGGYAFRGDSIEQWLELIKNNYNQFQFERSSVLCLSLPNQSDSVTNKYCLQVYKVQNENSVKQSRYLLHFKDSKSDVLLRVGGYVQNDVNHLFGHLLARNLKRKDISDQIIRWSKQDRLFNELNLECTFKQFYQKRCTSCDYSVFYIRENDLSVGYKKIRAAETYSEFSKKPLYGTFFR